MLLPPSLFEPHMHSRRGVNCVSTVLQNPSPNAYTLAIAGRKPFIVVHSALLELLEPGEVQAVLAHELGHLKCDHGVWLTAANVIASGTVSVRTALIIYPAACCVITRVCRCQS